MSSLSKFNKGVTLIELMIAIVILGILTVIAMPSYTIWIQNTQIRNAAQSIAQGMQRARAEAVARNTAATFTLSPDGTTFWSVAAGGNVIEQKPVGELGTAITLTDSTSTVLSAGETLTFTALGGIQGASPLQQINVDSSALSDADATELRVVIGASGGVLICDPSVSTAGDSRKCP